MPNIDFEWIEGNEGNYIYLYMLENLAKEKYFKGPSWAHSWLHCGGSFTVGVPKMSVQLKKDCKGQF